MTSSGIGVTRELLEWVEALAAKGAFVAAPDGTGGFEPKIEKLIRAVHTSLAGGIVQLFVEEPGDAAQQKELDDKLDAALRAITSSTDSLTNINP